MKLHTWYYNTRDSTFQDRWDYPVAVENGMIYMISYIIDAHGKKSIDWSRYNSSISKEKYWNEDHDRNKPVEDLKSVYYKLLQEVLSV